MSSFIASTGAALADKNLQQALARAQSGFVEKRARAVASVPNFSAMCDRAQQVRQKSLNNLDTYLLQFEEKVIAAGGHVHWASTPKEMREIVVQLCEQAGAKRVTKGKSMVGEEVYLNEALERANIEPLETDLGEYIIQLAKEKPSHIVAPALHKTREQIKTLFLHQHQLGERDLTEVQDIVNEAREVIRDHFLTADVGITGANILIAETGTAVVVTNEGNGDLTATLPKMHIITSSIEKVVENWNDASAIIRVLARSATGQDITSYTSFFTGPKKEKDRDGPESFHIVLLDNQRSEILGSEYKEMLQCIRCGACMNHCPVYQAVGGHTYNSVYPGPMGAVLTPLLFKEKISAKPKAYYQLPNASTFCGRCESVCPVRIPLPGLMRKLRDQEQREGGANKLGRLLNKLFCALASRPKLYRILTNIGSKAMSILGAKKGRFKRFPFFAGWTRYRDFPAPTGGSFQSQWRKRKGANE